MNQLNKKIEEALNKQIILESEASYQYLAYANWCDAEGFAGAAKFLYKHSDEERGHMLRLFRYINDKGGKAVVPGTSKPQQEFKTLKGLFETAYEYEKEVSKKINDIAGLCVKESDFTTYTFIQWYINEQLEEENLYRGVLDKFRLIGDEGNNLYLIDAELDRLSSSSSNSDVITAIPTN